MMRKFLVKCVDKSLFFGSSQARQNIQAAILGVWKIIHFGVIKYSHILKAEPKLKYSYFLSVVAIAKNEGCYFKEWIEYHRLVGVEKFYIYDNESTDNTWEVLKPYIDAGIVEYTYFPGEKQQIPAYQDWLTRHRYDTQWIAVIDLDEFIVPVADDTVVDFLKGIPCNTRQVVVGWTAFGSNGHTSKPKGLVIENYTRRMSETDHQESVNWGEWYKSIKNPRFIYEINVHRSSMLAITSWDEYKKPISSQRIRVHHYACKSWEEYSKKSTRGDMNFGKDSALIYTCDRFKEYDLNTVYDPIMHKYLDVLRARLEN